MKREKAMQMLSREMDGELTPRGRAALGAHLARHPADREIRDQWAVFTRLARAEDAAVPRQDEELAWNEIRRAVRTSAPERRLSPFFQWRLIGAAATVAVCACGALTFWRYGGGGAAAVIAEATPASAQVESVESGVPGTSPMIYQDDQSGVTMVWLMNDNAPANNS